MRRAAGLALAVFAAGGAPAFAAPPLGGLLTTTCKSYGQVGVLDCPQLDPRKAKLVAIEASFVGKAVFSVNATTPAPGPASYHASGTYSIDFNGGSFYFPISGDGTIMAGPAGSAGETITVTGSNTQTRSDAPLMARFSGTQQVHLISAATVQVSVAGGSPQPVGMESALTQITLVYKYIPTIGKLPPGTQLPKQPVPKLHAPLPN